MGVVASAARSLLAAPAFCVVTLVVLTLGIGASTAVFSVVDAVLLRGLPFDEADRLVAVSETSVATGRLIPAAAPNFLDWRAREDTFAALAAIHWRSLTLSSDGATDPEAVPMLRVTADFFAVLRVAPARGAVFGPDAEIEGRDRVAVVSHGFWQRKLQGADEAIGRTIRTEVGPVTIVGVLPRDFVYPVGSLTPAEMWMPLVIPADERVRGDSRSRYLSVIGRLRDGVSMRQAQTDLDGLTAALALETPRWFEDAGVRVEGLHAYLTGRVRGWLLMLLGAVTFVLLIACVNVANLWLVRATRRAREFGVRSAIGASRRDLARLVLAECLLVSSAGTALGVAMAFAGVDVLRSLMPAAMPRVADIAVDWRVLVAAAAAAIATGAAFAIAPILRFSRPDLAALLHAGRTGTAGPGRGAVHGVLVACEVALAGVLLVGAGLFLASFARVSGIALGFDHRDVVTVRLAPPVDFTSLETYEQARQRYPGLMLDVLAGVQAIPGVEAAAVIGGSAPLSGGLRTRSFQVAGQPPAPRETDILLTEITPDYLSLLGVPLLRGRFFTDQDRAGAEPVTVINAAAAERFFGTEDPVGRTVDFVGRRTIVGVVGTMRHEGPEVGQRAGGFVPFAQSSPVSGVVVVRTTRANDVVPAVRRAVWQSFPDLALPDVVTLEQLLERLIATRRFNMLLIGSFGLLGLVIAGIGVYGVMASAVAQRTREIGIRLALGAQRGMVLRAVVARAGRYLAAGGVAGGIIAWMLAQQLQAYLFEIDAHSLPIYAAAFVVLTSAGLAAAIIPARRASRVDPLTALRAD